MQSGQCLNGHRPMVRRSIEAKGIYITGGLSNMKGLSTYLQESIGLSVMSSPQAELCAGPGTAEKLFLIKLITGVCFILCWTIITGGLR